MVLPSLSRAARSQPCKYSKWGASLRLQKSPADYNCGGVKKRKLLRSFYPIPRADVFNTLNIKNSTLNIIFSPSLFALLTQSPATTAIIHAPIPLTAIGKPDRPAARKMFNCWMWIVESYPLGSRIESSTNLILCYLFNLLLPYPTENTSHFKRDVQ